MSKKFTSFLVVLAALLLTVPTQAQFAKKAAKQTTVLKAGPLKVNDVQKVKAAKMKAAAKYEGQAFTSKVFNSYLQAGLEKVQENKDILERQMEENLRATLHGNANQLTYGKLFANVQFGQTHQAKFDAVQSGKQTTRRAGGEEVVDEHGVITAIPEGETKLYQREGIGWYRSGSSLYYTDQAGTIEITELEDGTVYFKDFFSQAATGAYIKGTKNGNTITVPSGQVIYYWASSGYGMRTGFAEYTSNGFVETKAGDPYILTIDGNTISLTETSFDFNTATGTIAALLYTDDNTFCGYGDNSSVFTYDPDWVAPELVELPEGATVETWYSTATAVKSSGNATVEGSAKVAFVGDDVYLSGIFSNYPDSWIKGTIDGTTVTFSGLQFLGTYSSFDIYAVGSNGYNSSAELQDFKMTYDATSKKFTSVNSLLANAKKDAVYFLEAYENISITVDAPEEEVVTTGANVDAVPYANALATQADFDEFGVIDSNKDGSTWIFDSSYGASYRYNSQNPANDWLISPAIKLEAGKKYHFAIDAKAAVSSFPEKFEVLIGTEAKASALTQSVLPATEVAVTEYTTYENEAVEVAETGYYHFGIHAISDADQLNLMVANFLVEAGVEATAPAAVTDLAVAQTPDKLEAVVSFKAPTKTAAGEDLTDLTKIDVLRDGAVVKSFESVAGNTYNWVAASAGWTHQDEPTGFTFAEGYTATLSAGTNTSNAPRYWENNSGKTLRLYNGNTLKIAGSAIAKVVITFNGSTDLAANVGTYTLEGNVATWTGSADEVVFTAGSGKAFIESIQVETGLTLTPGAEYSYVDAEDLTIGTHVYQVIPYNASGVGAKSEEKSIFISTTLEVPYTFDFSKDLLDLFTVFDNNEDGKTWLWNANNGYAYNPYNSSIDADDYLITLPFNLKAGKRYNVIVNAAAFSESYPEKFEVKVGKAATVEGLTETVIPEVEVENTEFEDFEGVFAPTEDGKYYFAIHATSDANMYYLLVNALTIEIAPELTAPAAIADLTATAGAEGALEANLAFTAPAKAINDDALTGNVDVKIYRDGELVNTLTGVAAGSAQSWKDTNVENGKIYTYYVVAANESGDGLKSEKVKVFVGVDAPAAVENFTATDNGTSVSLTWQKVGNVGVNGGYVNTANVNYEVWSLKIVETMFGYSLDYDELLATVTDEDSYTVTLNPDEGDQDYKYWAVKPVNEIGEGAASVASLLVGAPYALPYVDSFTEDTNNIYESDGSLYLSDESSDEDGYSLMLTAEDEPGVFTVNTGKIGINNAANPTLIFQVKGVGVNKMDVVASVDGGAFQTLSADVTVTDEFTVVKVPLASIKNSRYVKLGFKAAIQNLTVVDIDWNTYQYIYDFGDQLLIDELRVVDLYEYNLVANIKAPSSVVAGKSAKVVATVTNEGENAAKDYTVTIKAGEKVLTTVLGSEELAPFAKDEIEVDFETSVFDEAGDVTLTVTVDFENELYPDDNTASTIITVKEPAAVAPTSLLAEDKGKAGVDLTWTVASAGNRAAEETVTEGFDDETVFEPFGLGGITADEHSGAFGDWTLYDGNGISTYGFNGIEFPNNYAPMAFIPFNPATVSESLASSYAPHSGEQFLISFCPAEENNAPATDHWLISPELSGDAQTISFYARAITAQYGAETFEIWASSTDNNVASFEKVADLSTEAVEWTEFTAALPAGTKYFAIRHTSQDIFGLLIDDVTYTAGNGSAPVAASFNIYYNNEKIATVDGDKTTYTVAADKVEVGTQTFGVSAVYANGAESRVTTATIEIVTGIEQIAADGKPVDVYSIDGKLIRNQAKSLDGLKGLYIVNGKKIMVK